MILRTNKGEIECIVINVSSGGEISVVSRGPELLSASVAQFEGLTMLEWDQDGETYHFEGSFSPSTVVRTENGLDSVLLRRR